MRLTTCVAMLATEEADKTLPESSRTDWRSVPNLGITRNRSFFSLFSNIEL